MASIASGSLRTLLARPVWRCAGTRSIDVKPSRHLSSTVSKHGFLDQKRFYFTRFGIVSEAGRTVNWRCTYQASAAARRCYSSSPHPKQDEERWAIVFIRTLYPSATRLKFAVRVLEAFAENQDSHRFIRLRWRSIPPGTASPPDLSMRNV